MANIIAALKQTSVPPTDHAVFQSWLEQEDAIAFLRRNTNDDDFVLYANMPNIFIHAVLAPAAVCMDDDEIVVVAGLRPCCLLQRFLELLAARQGLAWAEKNKPIEEERHLAVRVIFVKGEEILVHRDDEALLFDGAGNDGRIFLAGHTEIPGCVDVSLTTEEAGQLLSAYTLIEKNSFLCHKPILASCCRLR